MSAHKLVLELDDDMDNSVVLAIHCSEPDYKMTYMLNRVLGTRLKRETTDLEFVFAEGKALFPLFAYEEPETDRQFHLVANTTSLKIEKPLAFGGGLFGQEEAAKSRKVYLLPELKQADFFFKITSAKSNTGENVIVSRINEITQVITAYVVDLQPVKSRSNLIFE